MLGKWSFPSTCWPRGLSAEGAGETERRKGFCTRVLACSLGKLLGGRAFSGLASSSTHSFFSVQLMWAWQPKAASWQAACLVVLQQGASGSCSEWQPTARWLRCLASPTTTPPTSPTLSSSGMEHPVAPCREALLQVQISSMFHWCSTRATSLLSPRAVSPGWGGGLLLAGSFQPWSGSCYI